jgi:hypothetical protein
MKHRVFLIAAPILALTLSTVAVSHAEDAGAEHLPCTARAANSQPGNYSDVEIVVHTKPGAEVTGTEHVGTAHPTQQGVANSQGVAAIYFKVSYVIKRQVRTVTIVAKKGSVVETCRTSFDPT